MTASFEKVFAPIPQYDVKAVLEAIKRQRHTSPSFDIKSAETRRFETTELAAGGAIPNLFYFEECGHRYDFFYCPKPGAKKLFVIFSGARALDGPMPLFKRQAWNGWFDGDVLYVAEPLFRKYPQLALGWYLGDAHWEPMQRIAFLLATIRERQKYSEIYAYGSSGGGYAALKLGDYMPCCAIAINPQIFLEAYPYWRSFAKILGAQQADALLPRLPLRFDGQSSFLILQNDTDEHHMERHLFPLLEKNNLLPKYGLTSRDNLHIWIYHAVGGHNAQENPFLCTIIHDVANRIYPGKAVADHAALDRFCVAVSEMWARWVWDTHRLANTGK